jgi:hypothetical protein
VSGPGAFWVLGWQGGYLGTEPIPPCSCRELTEINRRHITESVNSIRRVSEAPGPPFLHLAETHLQGWWSGSSDRVPA